MSMEDVLAARAIDYARFLISCAEPIKAFKVLESVAPVSSLEHPDVLAMKASLRKQVDQFFSDADYVRRYTVYDNGGVPNEPFSDTGLLSLFRAKATIELAGSKRPERYLSIGGGEGTVPLHVMNQNPKVQVTLSELLGVGGDVEKALSEKHPGRVLVTGRYDVPNNHPARGKAGSFDVIECLEVVEHVTNDLRFLKNIRAALAPGGMLLLSTPNSVDWIESKLTREFGDGNWYHHVRAYTARSLATVMRKAGLVPTIFYAEKCLYVMAFAGTTNEQAYVKHAAYEDGADLTTQLDHVVDAKLLARVAGREVEVLVYQGVLLA